MGLIYGLYDAGRRPGKENAMLTLYGNLGLGNGYKVRLARMQPGPGHEQINKAETKRP